MGRVIEPLNQEARGTHKRIMVKLAYALAAQINEKEKLKKARGEN